MAKILLIDFTEDDRKRLIAENYDVDLRTTGWMTGVEGPLDLAGDSEAVFYQVAGGSSQAGAGLHAGASEALGRRIQEGAMVVCFIGEESVARVTDIVGPVDGLEIAAGGRAESIVFNPRALFHVPFERFRPYIAKTYRLLEGTFGEGVWEKESSVNGKLEFLAKTADGAPVALTVRKGKGSLMLLPSFGPKNAEVVECLLKDKRPLVAEAAGAPDPGWIESDEYAFPELKALVAKREDEKRRFEGILADYDRQIKEMKAGGQEEFHRLLDGDGAALKKAVVNALRYIGWGRVVDVDQYWKNTIRNKEEDAWVIEPADLPVEAGLRKGELVLFLVRGGKSGAPDDDCGLLQKFKGRRMQEFDNTRMKAVLVGNYHSGTAAKARPNPFTATQIEEARQDGNALVTTYELFRAVKAEKEGRLAKDAIRDEIKRRTGLIAFEDGVKPIPF